jgi:DNA polymerase III epsilon subunit-like protein
MPFRLIKRASTQCADIGVVKRRRCSVITVLQQFHDTAEVQCEGTTRAGSRCAVTDKANFRDGAGRFIAEPLRRGSRTCLYHLDLFCTMPVSVSRDFVVLYLDLETSGLDVLHDEVLEIAITADVSNAQFATTVLPQRLPEGLGVHGIDQYELLSGVPFDRVFNRLVEFLQDVTRDQLFDTYVSQEQHMDNPNDGFVGSEPLSQWSSHKFAYPAVLLAAHNGLKFDFPMLVSECIRHGCDVFQLAEFYFCDTLPLSRAFALHIGDGCARLQCLARCCCCCTGRQHRALEDTVVLRAVVQHCADYSGVSVQKLLGSFARRFDSHATLAARRFVS